MNVYKGLPDYIKALAVELNVRPGTRREVEGEPVQAELPSVIASKRMIERDHKRPAAGGDHEEKGNA